jgi:hypothetical protein
MYADMRINGKIDKYFKDGHILGDGNLQQEIKNMNKHMKSETK